MYYDTGIMDNTYMWEIEDQYFKLFGLKEDSYTFSEIYETGYEEFYLINREIMKNIDMSKIEINQYISDTHDYMIVLGFMHLKYQLSLPIQLKIELIDIMKEKLNIYDKKDEEISQFQKDRTPQQKCFLSCIEKEDGEGLINVGSILPKRTLYE